MGVRFQCPNGHKLHVKTELAGKRGICPECGARFVVPSFSGGRVPEDASAATPATAVQAAPTAISESGVRSQESEVGTTAAQPTARPIAQPVAQPVAKPIPSPPPMAQPVAEASSAPVDSEPIGWYVRPASGGQFGPATTEVFHEWIADGRVAADSWVWRTGWADWKAGSEALALVGDRPPQDPAAAMAAALADRAGAMPAVSTEPGAVASAIEANTAEQRRLAIKRRKQRMRTISGVLALVALAMLMALVFVLVR